MHIQNITQMEYAVEELKSALIEKCESEEYFVCTCKKVKDEYIVEEITKA